MKSIFRYPGGKTKTIVSKWILRHRPPGSEEYREPFVGGGGIFFAAQGFERRWINDLNAGLVEVYKALAERPDDFISKCRDIRPAVSGEEMTEPGPRGDARYPKRLKDFFDKIRLNTECDQAIRYFFVNRTVFAGRVNYDIPSRLYFSNPDGWDIVKTDRLERAAECLKGVTVTCGDYEQLLTEPGENVWIYADPPYVVNGNMSPTSQLYQHGFSEEDHRRFAEVVKQCPHKVAISYDDEKDGFVRSLFDGFRIEKASWRYCGSTNEKKEIGKELLIMNYDLARKAIAVVHGPDCGSEVKKLTEEEEAALAAAESEIEAGKQEEARCFVRKGNGLRIIQDRKLYLKTHDTFEAYCISRWGISRGQAYRLIDAAEIVNNLSPIGDIVPAKESQARPLAKLRTKDDKINHDQVSQVWESVVNRSKEEEVPITEGLVREEVNKALGKESPEEKTRLERVKEMYSKAPADEVLSLREWADERYREMLGIIAGREEEVASPS